MGSLFSNAGRAGLALLYPRHCALCKDPLEAATPVDQGLCEGCAGYLLPLEPPFCEQCSEPLAGNPGPDAVTCENCLGHRWKLDGAVCALRGSQAAWELVHLFKYGRRSHLAPLLGRHLQRVFEDRRIYGRGFDALVPVPLHVGRERERGFNQARLLAEQLDNAPVQDLLIRARETGTQTRLSRTGRQQNLRGAFQVRQTFTDWVGQRSPDHRVRGKSFLLIDDVFTTGSTLDECARVLKAAGAREVWAATLVRAGGAD